MAKARIGVHYIRFTKLGEAKSQWTTWRRAASGTHSSSTAIPSLGVIMTRYVYPQMSTIQWPTIIYLQQ